MKRAYKSLEVGIKKNIGTSFLSTDKAGIRTLGVSLNRMKRTALFFGILILLAGCDIYLIEEPVPWDDRDMFVGHYQVEEYSKTTGRLFVYDITVDKAWNRDHEIRIRNFYGTGLKVYGIVNGNRLTIPLQVVDGYEIEGTGRLTGDRLDLSFIARDLYEIPVFTDFVDAEAWLY